MKINTYTQHEIIYISDARLSTYVAVNSASRAE